MKMVPMTIRKIFGLPVLLAALLAAAPVHAQSDEMLKQVLDKLQRLERDIRTLNLQVSRGGVEGTEGGSEGEGVSSAPNAMARIAVRVTDMEDELRAVTGRVENMSFEIVQMKELLERMNSDIDLRLRAMESGAPAVSAAPSPPGVQKVLPGAAPSGTLGTIPVKALPDDATDEASAPSPSRASQQAASVSASPSGIAAQQLKKPTVLPEGSAKDRYKFSFGLLRRADYAGAELAFEEFIELHSDDPLVGNARYWLGESHYVRGQYVKAAEVFLAGYQADPSSQKAPDTLLKLGMSLLNLDKKAQACASFEKLATDFTDLSGNIASKLAAEKKRAGCE
ncbi:MAG: tol-pal system protein YbgF [Rhodospirillaceae bacterium]|nr:tol-pal system protein YbgF [Rhodospirillaceae bacterium]